MVLAYDVLLEDRRKIDVIITKFFLLCLLRIKILFYVTGQKIRYKKSYRGTE